MSKYIEQYPESGYVIKQNVENILTVCCPMHGDFTISTTNFYYQRGCEKCRGVHPRAYPLSSNRDWKGHPVYINDLHNGHHEVSMTKGDFIYAVGYSDRRIAWMVRNLAYPFTWSGDFELVRHIFDHASGFKIALGEKRHKTIYFSFENGAFKLLPLGELPKREGLAVPMRNGLVAALIHHLISAFGAINETNLVQVQRLLTHASTIR